MEKVFFVYILANHKNGTLYIGFTSDRLKRIWQHENKQYQGFTEKYNIHRLVYFETFTDPINAIKWEKRLKKYPRKWKINLIEKDNPDWLDLKLKWTSGLPYKIG